MKKLITFILFIAVVALAVNYSMPLIRKDLTGYSYADYDIEVHNPDIFKKLFGAETVDKVYYDYAFRPSIDGSPAYAIVTVKIFIGDEIYTSYGFGTLSKDVLPSGDILYYGPLDGTITIGEESYVICFSFTKVESSKDVSLSLCFYREDCWFDFGDNVFKGEVLDHWSTPKTN
jgi:hypothetical protein